jgi:hypothetical protein
MNEHPGPSAQALSWSCWAGLTTGCLAKVGVLGEGYLDID